MKNNIMIIMNNRDLKQVDIHEQGKENNNKKKNKFQNMKNLQKEILKRIRID